MIHEEERFSSGRLGWPASLSQMPQCLSSPFLPVLTYNIGVLRTNFPTQTTCTGLHRGLWMAGCCPGCCRSPLPQPIPSATGYLSQLCSACLGCFQNLLQGGTLCDRTHLQKLQICCPFSDPCVDPLLPSKDASCWASLLSKSC